MLKQAKDLSARAIRAMPYDMRLRNYEREKNELFDRIAHMSAGEVAEAHAELARKWGI